MRLLLALLLTACGGASFGASRSALVTGWDRDDIASARAMRLFAIDWDGDGDLDLFVSQRYGPTCPAGTCGGTPNPGRILWLENTGGLFTEHELWDASHGERGMIACDGDLDGDGVDFVVPMEGWQGNPAGPQAPTIRVVLRPSDQVVSIPIPSLLATRTLKGCDLADRDGDGDLDLALTAGPNPRMVWTLDGPLLTAQQGSWVQRSATSWGSKVEEPAWCDVNGDSTLDLCISEEQQGRGLVWFDGIGTGIWTPSTISDRFLGSDGIRVGLYDSDSLVDVLGGWEASGTTGQAAVSLHFSGSHLTRQWATTPILTGLTGIEAVEACDLTGDGVTDFVIAGESGEVRIATSNAALDTWGGGVLDGSSVSDRWLTIACADFDGDGWRDIAVGGETLGLSIFYSPGF